MSRASVFQPFEAKHMEVSVVLIAGLVLCIPVIAVVALVRTGKLRDLLDQANTEHRRELEFLRNRIEHLQRELRQISERGVTPTDAPRVTEAASSTCSRCPFGRGDC
jgi:hypothetical protein